MFSTLSQTEMETLLYEEHLGHLGYMVNGTMHIIPINFVYDGKNIFLHTYDGEKIDALRSDPHVCFQVEHVKDLWTWDSVMIWGNAEELHRKNAVEAAKILMRRFAWLADILSITDTVKWATGHERGNAPPVLLKIAIENWNSRCGRPDTSIH